MMMGLEEADVVDAVGIDKASGFVILTIADSWDWQDEERHLRSLRKKIDAYLDFIDQGHIWESYPEALGQKLVIDIISHYPMPDSGVSLVKIASEAASQIGVMVKTQTYVG